jgi:superfamily II DNA or RNA helicase
VVSCSEMRASLPPRVQDLFETVRDQASRSAWSTGVELARAEAVVGEHADESEILLRVRSSGSVVHPTVILYPQDCEWECDCGSSEDPCAHVAAAAIAVRRVRREGGSLPSGPSGGAQLSYRFTREGGGLAFERYLVTTDGETPLRTTLTALASGRVQGPSVVATQADIATERALGSKLRGLMPRGILRNLLRALQNCPDVRLDGQPVKTSPEPVGLRARLVDAPTGFRLFVERDPPERSEVCDGFALCGGTLRELAESQLTGRELQDFRPGRTFTPDQVTELLTEVLPSLRDRIPVEVETERLPSTASVPPRIVLQTEREKDRLSVLPTLVYGDPPNARVDGGRLTHLRGPIPLRDEAAERVLIRSLRSRFGLLPGHRVALDPEEAIAFTAHLEGWPGEVAGRDHESFFLAPPLAPELLVEGERFELRFHSREPVAPGEREESHGSADPDRVMRAWRAGESLVPLLEGGLAPLPRDWLSRLGPQIEDLLSARGSDGSLPRSAIPDLARLCDALDQPRPASFGELDRLVSNFAGIPEAPLPGDLRATLRGYQRAGVNWLCFLREAKLGGLLADDMGLGKTLQALCALRGRTLVVAPTSLLHNWSDEIARFRPDLRVQIFHGKGRAIEPEADITLTTYALLRLDREALVREDWETVILDEAQAIKNPESQVAQAAYQLRAGFRIALTGTPVENRLDELWSQFHFTNPGLLGGRRDFERRYTRPIGEGGTETAERLRERIRPFVLRRLKRDVAPELPPRTDVVLHCVLGDSERSLYEAIRAATARDVVERLETGGSVLAALEALLRLRQACCHPALVPGQDAEDSAKLSLLLDRLDTAVADGHKALVFSQWTSLLDLVEPRLDEAGIPYTRLDGTTRDRAGVLRRFQQETGPPVFLVSLKAGGTGLNLTSADHVFLLDPWWNPFVEEQAADRAHRIGQERPVFVYRMVAENTVEEQILALQEKKRSVSEMALGESGAAHRITRDDLLALLR